MTDPKTLVLVQGPESARYWVHRYRQEKFSASKWVVYDSRSAEILAENGIAFVRDNFYLDSAARERSKNFEKSCSIWLSDFRTERTIFIRFISSVR